jgi:hypothetical protein
VVLEEIHIEQKEKDVMKINVSILEVSSPSKPDQDAFNKWHSFNESIIITSNIIPFLIQNANQFNHFEPKLCLDHYRPSN